MTTYTLAPTASERAYQLSEAITEMALRYGSATRKGAYAFERVLSGKVEARAEMEQWERTARRRLRALQRLAAALRDLPLKRD